ncbi:pectin lyase-like protein [Aspergillus germanicus]
MGKGKDWSEAESSKLSIGDAAGEIGRRAVCTPQSLGSSQLDDTPAIRAAITSCGNGGTIVIPADTTYSLRTMLDFTGCNGCDFQLEGTLKSSTNTTYWASQPGIIYLNRITGATIRSVTGSGVLDGNGQAAYDEFAVDESLARPTAVYIVGGSQDIAISGLTVKNPPNVFFGQKGAVTNINYSNLTMTAQSKSTNLPRHTDGFSIGESRYTTIRDVYISNQDDCIGFKSGANYVTVERAICAGTNHGTVVGSLGKTNDDYVKNVYVKDLTIINCGKAAGIKVYPGGPSYGTSTVTNVTWDTVTVEGCDYGVQVESCYNRGDDECDANPSAANLTDINFINFAGITNAKRAPAVANLNCPAAGICDLMFSGWDVDTPNGSPEVLCENLDGDHGITCVPGASG